MKNIKNLQKKFCELPPRALLLIITNVFIYKYNYFGKNQTVRNLLLHQP